MSTTNSCSHCTSCGSEVSCMASSRIWMGALTCGDCWDRLVSMAVPLPYREELMGMRWSCPRCGFNHQPRDRRIAVAMFMLGVASTLLPVLLYFTLGHRF